MIVVSRREGRRSMGVIHLLALSIRSSVAVDVLESTVYVRQRPLQPFISTCTRGEPGSYLKCSSHAIYTVISFFRGEALQCQLYRLALLRNQIISPAGPNYVSASSILHRNAHPRL